MSDEALNERRLGRAASLALLLASGAGALTASKVSADILVVAPHPDDDIITSAGITYASLHRATPVPVWIVYMTNGDSPGVTLGYQRQDEGAAAEALLGVNSAHLVFLGYPDGSLGEMRVPQYASASSAYDSPNSGVGTTTNGSTTFPPYGRISGTNGNNNAANVRADLFHFLNARRPSDIYVTGRCDRHPDHSAAYEYVIEAVQLVRNSVASYDPNIHQTIVWAGFNDDDDWPAPTNPATLYTEPVRLADCLADNNLVWSQRESVVVPSVMQTTDYSVNVKARAIDQHQTQGGFNAISSRSANDGHISAFVHRDEFFYPSRAPDGDPPPIEDAGPPPPVDAGPPPPVDAGPPPPVDSGSPPPPVDAGSAPRDAGSAPVDAGAPPPVDAGARDAGSAARDAGAAASDAGAQRADAGPSLDAGAVLADAGVSDANLATSLDAMVVADARVDMPSPQATGGAISAWPGPDNWEEDVGDALAGDGGVSHGDTDSGCSVALDARQREHASIWGLLSLVVTLLRRRRQRSAAAQIRRLG